MTGQKGRSLCSLEGSEDTLCVQTYCVQTYSLYPRILLGRDEP